MLNSDKWQPTKYIQDKRGLRGSRDSNVVGVGSRLITDIIAHCYALLIPQYCHGRLLDLGCGEVPFYGTYKALVTDVTCVDWPNSIHSNIYLDMQCNISDRLPFEDNTYNTVLLSDVLEHIPEPQSLCTEIARILAPGGRFIMNVPFYYWLHEQPHDYYRYTEYALRRLMDNAGLKTLMLEPIGGAAEIIIDILSKQLAKHSLVSKWLSSAIQELTARALRPGNDTLWTHNSSRSFPLAYILVAELPFDLKLRK